MNTLRDKTLPAGIAAILVLAAAAVFWSLSDYSKEREAHERILLVRGRAVLSALEGGLRAHRRLGGWFRQSVDDILEETAATSGILGLAVFTENGERLGSGGEFPDTRPPLSTPRWVDQGLVLGRRMRPVEAGDDFLPGFGRGRRAGRGGDRDGPDSFRGMGPIQGPLWLAVLLDAREYREGISKARIRLGVSLAVTILAAILIGAMLGLIGRQRRLGLELELAREREGRLEEMTRLGAGLAHETKNPIGIVRGLGQSLADNPDRDERRRLAQQIVDESDRLVSRINAFLQYARPPAPEIQPVRFDELASQTADLFRDETQAREIRLEKNLERCEVLADPGMIRQVLVNLLVNALAACDAGDSIEMSLRPGGAGDFVVEVRDTGSGIDEDDLPHITKPYFTRRPEGVGLGLSIVQQIVRAHGWTLEIDSKPGAGTTVRIAGRTGGTDPYRGPQAVAHPEAP